MKIKKPLLIILVILLLLLLGGLLYIILSKELQKDEIEIDSFYEEHIQLKEEEIEEVVIVEEEDEAIEEEREEYILKESAWMPPWYFNESFQSLKEHVGIIDTVNPVFYSVNSNGSLSSRKPNQETVKQFLNFCRENDIRVIPTIGSFSFSTMDSVLSSKQSVDTHVKNIISELDKYNFDGIDIDYERIRTSRKDNYEYFLGQLSLELDKRNKVLSVAIFPQWGDNINYSTHKDTVSVQDLSLLSDFVDEVRIMTYDYTLQSSSTPGPIGPINWMEDVLEYTLANIEKEKIWMGVHLYAYRWKEGEAVALTPASFRSIVNSSTINTQFREDIAEGYAEYSCDSTRCFLYFQTKEGVNLRRNLARRYEIAGVAYWSLGRDDGILK